MSIARGAALNLLGLALPLPLAVLVVPPLLAALGKEGFGLLTLFWALSAYASVFDLGLGRALTQRLAIGVQELGRGAPELGALCSTAIALLAVLGLFFGVLLLIGAETLMQRLSLQGDPQTATASLRVLSLSLPLVVLSAGFRGVLEALQAFGRVNAVRLPLGIWTLLGPWLAVHLGGDLLSIAWLLLAGRGLACMAWGWMAWRALPGWQLRPARRWLRPLLSTGGWLTVGNLVGPLIGYADRFLVAALISVSAAAYYATPQELVSKLWVLPGALMGVMYPALAVQLQQAMSTVPQLCTVALRWIVLLCLPLSLGLALFAQELLKVWLGAGFAAEAAPVLRWMALGMYLGCVAQLPYTLLQSGDGAATTAKLHLLELPCFLLAMILAAAHWGVSGAAWVWALRNGLDAFLLFLLSHRRHPQLVLWGGASRYLIALPPLAFAGIAIPSWSGRFAWLLLIVVLLLLASPPRLLKFLKP